AALKTACPKGVYVAPDPDEPLTWTGVLFPRRGPYAAAVLRFHVDFSPSYPTRPPIITFRSDIFHPLVTPLTTYTHTARDAVVHTVSSADEEKLPPGGFALQHGFPEWFTVPSKPWSHHRDESADAHPSAAEEESPSESRHDHVTRPHAHIVEVLQYLQIVFACEAVIDSIPLDVAANSGAWHAWRAYRTKTAGVKHPSPPARHAGEETALEKGATPRQQPGGARRPGEWNWQGVWEDRVRKSILVSNSEAMLYGDRSDAINFRKLDAEAVKQHLPTEMLAWSGMANKENQPPGTARYAEQCTPPGSAPRALGLRPWQTTAFASPPFRAISPNSRPSLIQQRDHSACRRPDTPLKVRKTRENLRQDAFYTGIPPPCLHLLHDGEGQDHDHLPHISETSTSIKRNGVHHTHGYSEACASSLPSLPPFHPDDYPPVMSIDPPASTQAALPTTPRMHRHRTVSRRMLSKVKQGIASRARATPTVRPTESETSLIRRISGRRRRSVEVERRAQSFEISRDSVASVLEGDGVETSLEQDCCPRSVTQSTISTTDVLGDLSTAPNDWKHNVPDYGATIDPASSGNGVVMEPRAGSPLTPRPLCRSVPGTPAVPFRVCLPFINTTVTVDRSAVDAGTEQQVWTALEASVAYRDCTIDHGTVERGTEYAAAQLGVITSLRLCFKPVDGCSIIELVGQKGLKNLTADQTCTLFIKVQVPKIPSASAAYAEDDQASLLTELESMVGTLQTEVLHLEARYRHSLLPYDNVVAVKNVVRVKRPQLESRWSMISATDDLHTAEQLHTKLAIYIADHYALDRALTLIDRHLAAEAASEEPVRQIRATVAAELERGIEHENPPRSGAQPAVVVTEFDVDSSLASRPTKSAHPAPAPGTPVEVEHPNDGTPLLAAPPNAPAHAHARSSSMHRLASPPHDASTASEERGDAARKI
ncbi:Protein crossbronx, partial [Teratosphaeria destructans]